MGHGGMPMPIPMSQLQPLSMSMLHPNLHDRSHSPSNLYCGPGSDDISDANSGMFREHHGSVEDIEHFFISADDWDRSQ